ncbi:DUF4837 family protein [Aquimarina intermedia]|uniref:Uncharacterized protein DUF4837 n=1 Tax=Aquimarina intermedia TaxID=350814 RepID=A0A5S5CCK2_9FLAO|nr:DUF4837 family protein [Aquimarina intermedia]TYP76889.1 uncharacterized protein DUF4837 [Aquimarina intermedia]
MRNLMLALLSLVVLYSCSESKSKTKATSQDAMAHSVGRINELSVIVDNELWKGAVGDSIRKYFGAEVPGLPQEEPLFSMRQMPPVAFSGMARKNRTFLKIEKTATNGINILKNKFATPQVGAVISGTTDEEIVNLIRQNVDKIVSDYKKVETVEKQKRIKKSLEKIPQLKNNFGITMKVPSAYRIAKDEDKFMWIRKDIPQGSMNLMVYELPAKAITRDSTTVSQIIKMRDSIGALNIPTSATGKFITEKAYAPYLFENTLDGKFALETKGIWEIKDRFMSGPFVNYIIEDEANDRTLVLEGFVFAPSVRKRDKMFELEAIMKSIKIQ